MPSPEPTFPTIPDTCRFKATGFRHILLVYLDSHNQFRSRQGSLCAGEVLGLGASRGTFWLKPDAGSPLPDIQSSSLGSAWGGLTRERGYGDGIDTQCELQPHLKGRVSARSGSPREDPDDHRGC